MGLITNIIDKVKETYNKADTALGGYLPGGSTPAEVSAASQPAQPAQSTQLSAAPVSSAPFVTENAKQTSVNGRNTFDSATNTFTDSYGNKSSVSPSAIPAGTSVYNSTNGQTSIATGSSGRPNPTASSGASSVVSTPTKVSAPSPNVFGTGTGTYSAASGKQKFFMSPVGKILSGFWSGLKLDPAVDSNGVELQTQDPAYSTAKIIGYIGSIASVGSIGSDTGLLSRLRTLKTSKVASEVRVAKAADALIKSEDTFKAMNDIQAADNAFINTPNGANLVAETIPEASGFIKGKNIISATSILETPANTKNARTISTMIKELFLTKSGSVKFVGLMSATSFIVGAGTSSYSSNTQIKGLLENGPTNINELRKAGLNEQADQAEEMINGISNTSWLIKTLPYFGRSRVSNKINDYTEFIEPLVQEAKNKLEADKKANEAFVGNVDAKIKAGADVSQDDLITAANLDPGGLADQTLAATEEIKVNQEVLANQNAIINKMIGMDAKSIITDPSILAAVNDPINADSLLVQLYNNAYREYQNQIQTEQERAYQAQQTAEQRAYDLATKTVSEPASTLKFGLLKSGGATRLANKNAAAAVGGAFITDPEQIAETLFGIPYGQLSDIQKEVVNNLI